MTQRSFSLTIFALSLALALGVYAWFYPLNRGTLTVAAGVADYRLTVDGVPVDCAKDPCQIPRLKRGTHTVRFEKERYTPEEREVFVTRSGLVTGFMPRRIYELVASRFVPPAFPAPAFRPRLPARASGPFYSADGQSAAWVEGNDGSLWVMKREGAAQRVTHVAAGMVFEGFYGPQDRLLLLSGFTAYWVDLERRARLKTALPFTPAAALWKPDGNAALLADGGGSLFSLSETEGLALETLGRKATLKNAAWEAAGTLLSAEADEAGTLLLRRTDFTQNTQITLASAPGGAADRLVLAEDGATVYVRQQNGWLEAAL